MNSINKPMGLRRGNLLLGLLLVLLCFAVVWGGMNAAWAYIAGPERATDIEEPSGVPLDPDVSYTDYTLYYDANGGMNPPESDVYSMSELDLRDYAEFVVKGQEGMSRVGYAFLGWDKDPEATTPTYKSGDSLIAGHIETEVILYAIWAPETSSLQITATVPAQLPIHIDASGNAVVSQNAVITNNSAFGLACTGVSIAQQNGWTQVREGYNFATDKVGAKNFALTCSLASNNIPAGASVAVNYNAKLSPSEQGLADEQIATVTYTLEWDGLYTVKWVDDDGTLFTTQNGVDFGNPPDTSSVKFPGTLPTKEGYTLTGWHVTLNGTTVTCEAVWQALADDASIDWEYTTDDTTGTITLTKYIGESNDVSVKNKYLAGGKVYENVALGESGYDSDTDAYFGPFAGSAKKAAITSVALENEVILPTNASGLFLGCNALVTVSAENCNTGNVTNMNSMFYNCSNLTTLKASGWDTSSVTSVEQMFYNCSALTTLDVSNWDTSNVTTMKQTFSNCKTLATLDVSGWDTSSVTSMSGMFQNCSSLTMLDVSGWDTGFATDMSAMFGNCAALATLDVSGWDTASVTNMRAVFGRCSALVALNVSNWNISSVTKIDGMFQNCSSLTTLDLSGWNTAAVTDMGRMFDNCRALQEITLGSHFAFVGTGGYLPTPSSTYIPGADGKWYTVDGTAYAPSEIPNNTANTYYAVEPAPAANIDWKHTVNDSTNTITLTEYIGQSNDVVVKNRYSVNGKNYENVALGESAYNYVPGRGPVFTGPFVGSAKKTTITSVTLEDGVKLPTDCGSLFSNCSALKSVNTESWDITNATNMSSMFNNCKALTTLDVSNWDTSAVTDMSSMFNGCVALTTLDISNWDTSAVTSMSSMFYNCIALTMLNVSNWDTSAVTSMSSMFNGCVALTTLDVSNWDTSAVTNMSRMFYNCIALTMLNVRNWDTSNVTDMHSMFGSCGVLTVLDVSKWDTSKVTDMNYMFAICRGLASLDVSGWETGNVTDVGQMFQDCDTIAMLDLSNWDTSAVTDMSYMFQSCRTLASIYASPSFAITAVTSSTEMFTNCTRLVGGNGTIYSSSYTDATYARIDTPETPGYFTAAPGTASLNSLDVEADSVDENVADGSDAAQVTITVSFVLEDGTVVDQKLVEAILGAAYDVSSVVELLPEGYEIAGEISGELAGEATEDTEVIVPVKAVLADGEDPTPSPEPSTDEAENGNGEEGEGGNGEGDNTPSPAPTPEVTPEPTPTPEATPEPLPEQTEIDETDVEPEGWTKEEDLTPAA